MDQGVMKSQERRGLKRDGSLSKPARTVEDRPESAEPVAGRGPHLTLASAAEDEQLVFEQEVLCQHPPDTGAAELRGRDGDVKQGEQHIPHSQVTVGQTQSAEQRCRIRDSARDCQFETDIQVQQREQDFLHARQRRADFRRRATLPNFTIGPTISHSRPTGTRNGAHERAAS
jgi:hypothetical protein